MNPNLDVTFGLPIEDTAYLDSEVSSFDDSCNTGDYDDE